ncbi:MAG: hypothetical protein ABSB42_22925 [Tepidisphaeraceae bacterium]
MKSRDDSESGAEVNGLTDPVRLEIHKLAINGATNRDISELLKIGEPELEERFGALLVEARAERRVMLRKLQNAAAQKGNAGILTLLGKHELGQTKPGASDDHWPEPQLDPKVG